MNLIKKRQGFSLIELIVVIAIMAVLVAILAPQFLKYVERSRNSADINNARSILTALQIYYADPDNASAAVTAAGTALQGDSLMIDKDSAVAASSFTVAALKSAGLTNTGGKVSTYYEMTDIKCRSKSAWYEYDLNYQINAGQLTLKSVVLYGKNASSANTIKQWQDAFGVTVTYNKI